MQIKNLLLATIVTTFLAPIESNSKPIVIAVLDTGIDKASVKNLCKYGHKSLVDSKPLVDTHGHGTHIAGIINRVVGDRPNQFCIVSIKWYNTGASEETNVLNMAKAVQYAVNIKADYINISGGGTDPKSAERHAVINALDAGIVVVAAAGNNNYDIGKDCNYYPACYDKRIITVGNAESINPLMRHYMSNYGDYVKRWEIGVDVLSDLPGKLTGKLTGTSQATAVATGKLVRLKLSK